MSLTHRDRLPLEAVRDLLGIARALYAAERKRGAEAARLARIHEAGKALALALELASKTEPDTIGHRASWQHAEHGLELLADCVEITTALGPVLEAAGARIGRRD